MSHAGRQCVGQHVFAYLGHRIRQRRQHRQLPIRKQIGKLRHTITEYVDSSWPIKNTSIRIIFWFTALRNQDVFLTGGQINASFAGICYYSNKLRAHETIVTFFSNVGEINRSSVDNGYSSLAIYCPFGITRRSIGIMLYFIANAAIRLNNRLDPSLMPALLGQPP